MIAEHGHALVGVFPTEDEPGPCFTYTVGLALRGLPELVIVGPNNNDGGVILNSTADQMAKNGALVDGNKVMGVANMPPVARDLEPTAAIDAYFGQWRNILAETGEPMPMHPRFMQLVWPDPAGRYPWEEGFDGKFSWQTKDSVWQLSGGGGKRLH